MMQFSVAYQGRCVSLVSLIERLGGRDSSGLDAASLVEENGDLEEGEKDSAVEIAETFVIVADCLLARAGAIGRLGTA